MLLKTHLRQNYHVFEVFAQANISPPTVDHMGIPNNIFRNSFSTKLYLPPTRQLEHSLYMEEWEGNYLSSIAQGNWQMSRVWRTVSALF